MLTLRYGTDVRALVTNTPLPIPLLKNLLAREGKDVAVTRGTTYDNRGNLPETFIKTITDQYGNTRLARQEIFGELLEDVEGALWTLSMIDEPRFDPAKKLPELERIVIGVDPATTGGEKADWTGIIACGMDANKVGYVLSDRSIQASPNAWAKRVVKTYHHYNANLVIAERNQGGEMVSEVIRAVDPQVPVKLVHAKKGKIARAEPVANLYEQGKVRHFGVLPKLEDEMTSYVPGESTESPDRLDAMVYGITELMVKQKLFAGTWGR